MLNRLFTWLAKLIRTAPQPKPVFPAAPEGCPATFFAALEIAKDYDDPEMAIAVITMQWGELEGGGGGGVGSSGTEAVYEFSYQSQPELVYLALATRVYGGGFEDPQNETRINVDPQTKETRGKMQPGGGATFTLRRTVPASFVNQTYELLVESLVDGVNGSEFLGRAAGTTRFVSCNSSVTSGGMQSIAWGFQYRPNRADVTIAGIEGVDIGGHELTDPIEEVRVNNDKKITIVRTRAMLVHQVFPLVDLNQLF